MNTKILHRVAVGFAMFTMFFGAGNVIFPLITGAYAKEGVGYALIGFLLTGVGVPFMGLFAMTLFNGDYRQFFAKMGKIPGYLAIVFLMALIGPFGAIPRCITVAFETVKMFFPDMTVIPFAFASCLIIFLAAYRKNKMVNILGVFITPLLLFCLAVIVVKGLYIYPEQGGTQGLVASEAIWYGLKQGYNTMDLLGAFFFCSVVVAALKKDGPKEMSREMLIKETIYASSIGAFLLAATYIGFSIVASLHSVEIEGVPNGQLLGAIAFHVLGPYAGIIACAAVAIACLTTAIALIVVFSDYIREDVFNSKVSYGMVLIGSLIVTGLFSTLEFDGIYKLLGPIVGSIYPFFILLTIYAIATEIKKKREVESIT